MHVYVFFVDVYSLWDKTQISKIEAPPRGGSPEVTMKTPIYIKIANGCSSQHSYRKIRCPLYILYCVYIDIYIYMYIYIYIYVCMYVCMCIYMVMYVTLI